MKDICKKLLIIGSFVSAAGCGNDHSGAAEPVDLAQAAQLWDSGNKQWGDTELITLEDGRRLYRERCAACHQQTGNLMRMHNNESIHPQMIYKVCYVPL